MSSAPKGYNQWLGKAASAYGADAGVLDEIAFLENGRKAKGVNDWDSNAKAGHPSQGINQYIPTTFDDFSKQAKAANPKAWKNIPRNIGSWKAQMLTTSWALQNGKGSHWSTYDRAQAKAGSKPGQAQEGGGAGDSGESKSSGIDLDLGDNGLTDSQANAVGGIFKNSPYMQKIMKKAYGSQNAMTEGSGNGSGDSGGSDSGGGSDGGGGGTDIGKGWNHKDIQAMALKKFGLRNDAGDGQTTGGSHARNSLHYIDKAVDFGDAKNSVADLKKLGAWAKKNRKDVKQFYYDQLDFYIQDGQVVEGQYGGHGDHAHLGVY